MFVSGVETIYFFRSSDNTWRDITKSSVSDFSPPELPAVHLYFFIIVFEWILFEGVQILVVPHCNPKNIIHICNILKAT